MGQGSAAAPQQGQNRAAGSAHHAVHPKKCSPWPCAGITHSQLLAAKRKPHFCGTEAFPEHRNITLIDLSI